MCSCSYRDKVTCAKKVNNNIHDGTRLKFNAFEKYTYAWLEKIVNFNKNKRNDLYNVNFIDCMASSGLYFDHKHYNDFYDGTAIRIFRIFVNSARKYKDIQFNIFLNDYDSQYIECLKCVKKHVVTKLPNNLKITITEMDKYDYINFLAYEKVINGYGSKNLIIYDPYDVDFNWKYLSKILNINADFLFTHFFPNDIKRNMKTTNPDIVSRYEEAYCMNFNEIKENFDIESNSFKRTAFFRNRFHEILKNKSNKKFLAYAPVILKRTLHVYDIVCLSYSSFAQELLKNTMYSLYRECELGQTNDVAIQLKLFDDVVEDRYENDRNNGVSEFKFHYDDSHICKMFYTEFKGKVIPKTEFKKILRVHPYLPTNIMKMVKGFYKYKIEKKDINGEVVDCYIFPDGGFSV